MRPGIALIIAFNLLLFVRAASGQNLVPNPSFEQLDFCPFQINQIEAATGWQNWRETPELFNACASGSLNIPFTGAGFQYAHSGASMAGLVTYRNPQSPAGQNYREFIAIQLTQPLIPGNKYYVSLFANLADFNGFPFPSNNLGIKLTTVQYSTTVPFPLSNSAHYRNINVITDTINWTKCTGFFLADSAYTILCIGNFYHDSLTTVNPLSTSPNTGYYFIDDVCVTTDSIFNEVWTGINKPIKTEDFSIYPNPADQNINIICNNAGSGLIHNLNYSILDNCGKCVQKGDLEKCNSSIAVDKLKSGLYTIGIHTDFSNQYHRLLIK